VGTPLQAFYADQVRAQMEGKKHAWRAEQQKA